MEDIEHLVRYEKEKIKVKINYDFLKRFSATFIHKEHRFQWDIVFLKNKKKPEILLPWFDSGGKLSQQAFSDIERWVRISIDWL